MSKFDFDDAVRAGIEDALEDVARKGWHTLVSIRGLQDMFIVLDELSVRGKLDELDVYIHPGVGGVVWEIAIFDAKRGVPTGLTAVLENILG